MAPAHRTSGARRVAFFTHAR